MPSRASSASQASSARRAGRARADAAEQRVALRQRARVGGPRRRRGPARARPPPGRGGRAGRRARPSRARAARAGRRSPAAARRGRPGCPPRCRRARRRFASPGWKPASSRCVASSSRVSITTRATRGAAAHQLALVRRARRRAGAAEVDGLEQVGLAGAVGADHHGQPARQLQLGRLVVAEVAQLEAGDEHRPPLDVQADRHDQVDEAGALVARLDQARAAAG